MKEIILNNNYDLLKNFFFNTFTHSQTQMSQKKLLSYLICTPHGKHSGIHMCIFGNDLSVIKKIDTQLTNELN